jgi:hypothetical protein
MSGRRRNTGATLAWLMQLDTQCFREALEVLVGRENREAVA